MDLAAGESPFDTVPPLKVNEAYLTNRPAKRTIIHYIQPHAPYLSLDSNIGSWRGNKEIVQGKNPARKDTLYSALRKRANQKLEDLIGRKGIWRLRKLGGPSVEEFLSHQPAPWKGQKKGF